MQKYKTLIVWNKSMILVEDIYKITALFPRAELFGLTSQIRRCAISIPNNIAEGSNRTSKKEFKYFVSIAFGSAAELETQIEIAKRLHFVDELTFKKLDILLSDIMKLLNKLLQSLNN